MQKWRALFVCWLFMLVASRAASGAELQGQVTDNLGVGLSNLLVEAFFWDETTSSQIDTVTDASGYFSLSGGPGYWSIQISADELNSRGYFSLISYAFEVTNQVKLRFATRKLESTNRIAVHLRDESGQPLAGYSIVAGIQEYGVSFFKTNATTDAAGLTQIAAEPAVWNLCCLVPPAGNGAQRIFPERLVEVFETNAETQATFVAPAATSTISVTTSNLSGWQIVATTEAYGQTYTITWPVYSWDEVANIPVFDGVWTISVTNMLYYVTEPIIPLPPLTRAVTQWDHLCFILRRLELGSSPTSAAGSSDLRERGACLQCVCLRPVAERLPVCICTYFTP